MPTDVLLHKRDGYAVITLQKQPVNLLDTAAWEQISAAFASVESDPSMHGVIFTSGLKRDVFTAGNDFKELYAPLTSAPQYRHFWTVQNTFLINLYRSRLVTVAAIRGACPAAGCGIALCCDHRVMTRNGFIGLNEVERGIPVPKFWGLLMIRSAGQRNSEKLLFNGSVATPEEAQRIGLVDELVDAADLAATAETRVRELMRPRQGARAETKALLRGDFCREWEEYLKMEADAGFHIISRPEVVKELKGVMEQLSQKRAKM